MLFLFCCPASLCVCCFLMLGCSFCLLSPFCLHASSQCSPDLLHHFCVWCRVMPWILGVSPQEARRRSALASGFSCHGHIHSIGFPFLCLNHHSGFNVIMKSSLANLIDFGSYNNLSDKLNFPNEESFSGYLSSCLWMLSFLTQLYEIKF